VFPDKDKQPSFERGKDYYMVAVHGVSIVTTPYDVNTSTAVIPGNIEPHRGVIIAVLADTSGAPDLNSVIAGPLILQQS
jgi:hypothetical protein